MKRLLLALILCILGTTSAWAETTIDLRGDDDGFGSGTPLSPGDEVWIWPPGPGDPDGFDGYGMGTWADPDFTWTHNFTSFTSITGASLYVQLLDFPENGGGDLWIDGVKTSLLIPQVPLTSEAPWIVTGTTFDLSAYSSALLDGSVTFGFSATFEDAWSLDFARLTIEGTPGEPNPIPVPGGIALGAIGLGLVGWFRGRCFC